MFNPLTAELSSIAYMSGQRALVDIAYPDRDGNGNITSEVSLTSVDDDGAQRDVMIDKVFSYEDDVSETSGSPSESTSASGRACASREYVKDPSETDGPRSAS